MDLTKFLSASAEEKKELLRKLSIDDQRELLKKFRQLELKAKETVEFTPNAGAQERFDKSPAKIRYLCGGNGLGKTTVLVNEMIRVHNKTHPYRDVSRANHSWCLVDSYEKVESDFIPELKKWCPPSKYPKEDKMGGSHVRRFKWPNGNTTTFFSHEQDMDKLEGTNYDVLFINEPCPRSQWVSSYRGLRSNPDYFIVIAATPVSEPWMYTEIYQKWALGLDKSIEVFEGTTYENQDNLPPGYIEDYKSRLNEDEIKVRIYGKAAILQGAVFKEFDRRTHVLPMMSWPIDWPVYECVDPHERKPCTCVWLGVTKDDQFVIIDEASVEGVDELAKVILEKRKNRRIVCSLIDNSGNKMGWQRESAVQILQKYGIRVTAVTNAEKSIQNGITAIKSALKGDKLADGSFNPRMKVMENCVLTISDFELYRWDDYRHPDKSGIKETPRKTNDDFIDPIRYILSRNPRYHVYLESSSYARAGAYNRDYRHSEDDMSDD